MREPRPSLAYRLAWLFPPVGPFLFALVIEGPRILDLREPWNALGGVMMFVWFARYAWRLARDALNRRSV